MYAFDRLRIGEAPTDEERAVYETNERTKIKYMHEQFNTEIMNEEDFEFVEMPQRHLDWRYGSSWLGRTASCVQRVIEAIDYCYLCIRDLGYIPNSEVPYPSMTDEAIDATIRALNVVLSEEGTTWMRQVGYTDVPQFLDEKGKSLKIEDKRSIVAHIQKAIKESGIRRFTDKE